MTTPPLHATSNQPEHATDKDRERELTRWLDSIIVELDKQPPAARRVWLRLRKLCIERHVPPFYGKEARR